MQSIVHFTMQSVFFIDRDRQPTIQNGTTKSRPIVLTLKTAPTVVDFHMKWCKGRNLVDVAHILYARLFPFNRSLVHPFVRLASQAVAKHYPTSIPLQASRSDRKRLQQGRVNVSKSGSLLLNTGRKKKEKKKTHTLAVAEVLKQKNSQARK